MDIVGRMNFFVVGFCSIREVKKKDIIGEGIEEVKYIIIPIMRVRGIDLCSFIVSLGCSRLIILIENNPIIIEVIVSRVIANIRNNKVLIIM